MFDSKSLLFNLCLMKCFICVDDMLTLILLSPGPEVTKLFSCSTQLSTKFQLLIKTKTLTHKEVSCFKSLRCCIYLANKC